MKLHNDASSELSKSLNSLLYAPYTGCLSIHGYISILNEDNVNDGDQWLPSWP